MNKLYDWKKYIWLVITLLLLIFFHLLGWLTPVQNLARFIFEPFLKKENYIEIINTEKNIEELKQKNLNLETELKIIKQENTDFKKMLNFKNQSDHQLITAEIIGKNFDLTNQTLMINAGASEGISAGDMVLAGQGILVGRITKTEANYAFLRLLNDNQSKIAATILNNDRSLGVVQGGYGLSIKMLYIPRNEIVKVGDIIITSGLEQNTPKGLVIGTVEAVENEANQPFQQAIIAPAQNLDKISFVQVLKIQ